MITAPGNFRSIVSFSSSPAILLALVAASFIHGELDAQQASMAAAPSQPLRSLSMVLGDFDEDGYADLAIGSALKQGGSIRLMRANPEAIAPRTHAGWLAAGRHESTAPFLEPEETIRLKATPDLLTAADMNGDGHLDLAYASKTSGVLAVMLGTGKGSFAPEAASIALPGHITALAAYRPGAPILGEVLVVGYQTKQGAYLSIVSFGRSGLKVESTYALPGAATAFSVANLDDDFVPDTAVVAGGQLLILHGLNAIKGGGRLQTLPVDRVEAVAAGEFLSDRHGLMQLAALTSDGDVLILAHEGIDSRPFTRQEIAGTRHQQPGSPTLAQRAGNIANEPWTVVETDAQAGAHSSGSKTPILMRSRSGSGDDLVVLNSSEQQRVTIQHSSGTPNTNPSTAARISVADLRGADDLAGAVSVRTSADGRPGLAMLRKNSPMPEFNVPSPGNTFYVNTTADNTGTTTDTDDGMRCSNGAAETCTLRDAITFANADAGVNIGGSTSDTIMVPAGAYPLTWQAGTLDANGNAVTHLEVLGPLTIVGDTSGVGVTIDAMSNDVAFTINPGPYGSFNLGGNSYVFNTTLENITIQNGRNTNNPSVNTLANASGGGINWDAFGTGNLTLMNVIIQKCIVLDGPGGGLWVENSTGSGSGTVTLTGGSISHNLTAEEGGGIYDAYPYATIAASNTVISSNSANPSVSTSDLGGFGAGGGIYFVGRTSTSASPQSTLTGVQISSNYAAQQGAGVYTNSGILLSNSVVSSNTSGATGGGVYAQEGSEEIGTAITGTSISGNSAITAGGGVFVGDDNPSIDSPSVTMSLSRIFGNTSGGTTGLALNGVGAASATENWWGCNAGPANAPCDKADSAAVTNPWAELGFSANNTTVIFGNSMALTVSLNTDSNGQSITGAFPAVNGDSIGFVVTGVTANPALTSGTFSSAGIDAVTLTPSTMGSGNVSATFDNQTLSINFTAETVAKAMLISPTPGSKLGTSNVMFTWSPGYTVTSYQFWLGTSGPGSSNLYASGSTTATSATVTSIPARAATVYARLFSVIGGVTQYIDYTFTESSAPAMMSSPAPGSTLGGPNVTFIWTAGYGVTSYSLWLGTNGPGSSSLYNSGSTMAASAAVTGLPTRAATLYARLFSVIGGVSQYIDYTFTEAGAPATIVTPLPGSTLGTSSVTFTWTAGYGVARYSLWLGASGPGSSSIYASGPTTSTSVTVPSLLAKGTTVYARLFSLIGGVNQFVDYTYFESGTPATMITPAPGAALGTSNVKFTWTAGLGVTSYQLWLGTSGPGSSSIYSSGSITTTSATVPSLQAKGIPIYVRLFSIIHGVPKYIDYTYTEAPPGAPATMISPAQGSTLGTSNITFTWTTGTGVSQYNLWLGLSGPGSSSLSSGGWSASTSATVPSLPSKGSTVYARLFSDVNGVTQYNDYTYIEQ